MIDNILFDNGLEYRLNESELTASVSCDSYNRNLLKDVVIPSKIQFKNIEYIVNYIPIMAFEKCDNLKSIVIPKTVDRLLRSTFQECIRLEYLEIPASVKIFMPNLFYRCINLKRIIFENLEESNSNTEGFNLNEDAFRGCNKDVILEDKATGKEYRLK